MRKIDTMPYLGNDISYKRYYELALKHGDNPIVTVDGFGWTIHNVCPNPHTLSVIADADARLSIETAKNDKGLWAYGVSMNNIEGVDEGLGFLPRYNDCVYPNEKTATISALKFVLTKKVLPKYRTRIMQAMFSQKVTQLTLF